MNKPMLEAGMKIRINKFLADSGITSRRKAEELIRQGRVEVNENVVDDLSFKIDPEKDIVSVDGERMKPKQHIYLLLNKPKGVITSTSDEKKRRTVTDLINTRDKIFPVGRLDYNTTGVLLLTNDGEFCNLLTHPKNNVPKEYEVMLDKPLRQDDEQKLLKGIYLDDKKGKFISVVRSKKKPRVITVKSVEGRNHFIKRMFGALGYTVISLNRKSFAGLSTDLQPGTYRKLSLKEVTDLIEKYGL